MEDAGSIRTYCFLFVFFQSREKLNNNQSGEAKIIVHQCERRSVEFLKVDEENKRFKIVHHTIFWYQLVY
jgi:hypothetical protein